MRLQYLISEVSQGIRKNISIFVSVILVTFISFLFVGASILMQMQIAQSKGLWYDKVEVAVWMCPYGDSDSINCTGEEASDSEIDAIVSFIDENLSDEVESTYLESKEEVYQEFIAQYPEGIIEGETLSADDMQVVLRLKLVNPENYQIVADALTGKAGVEQVVDQREIFEPTFKLLNGLTMFAISLAVVMLFTAILLIGATIRFSAQARKESIFTMRLLGASNFLIKFPFVFEGVLATLIGSILSMVSLWLLVQFLVFDYLSQQISWMNFIGYDSLWITSGILFLLGILLSTLCGVISIRRYTKV